MSTSPVSGAAQNQDTPKAVADAVTAALKRVFDQFALSILRQTDKAIEPDDLGPTAKGVYDSLRERFKSAPIIQGSVASEVVMAAYQLLRKAHANDELARFDPGQVPEYKNESDARLPKGDFIGKSADKGRYQLARVGEAHLLRALFRATGLNPDSFSEKVRDTLLDLATSSYANLAGDRTLPDGKVISHYVEIGKKLKSLAVAEGIGGPKFADVEHSIKNAEALVASTGRTNMGGGELGVATQAGLGLEKSAPQASNTGSATGPQMQRLAGLLDTKFAAELTDGILKDLKATGVTREQKEKISAAFKSILEEAHAGGAGSPSAVLAGAMAGLNKHVKDGQGKGAAGIGLQFAETLRHADVDKYPGLGPVIAKMAIDTMGDLAACMLGKKEAEPSEETLHRLLKILDSLSKDARYASKRKGVTNAASILSSYREHPVIKGLNQVKKQKPAAPAGAAAAEQKEEVDPAESKIQAAIRALRDGMEIKVAVNEKIEDVAGKVARSASIADKPVYARFDGGNGPGLIVAHPAETAQDALVRFAEDWDPKAHRDMRMQPETPPEAKKVKDGTDEAAAAEADGKEKAKGKGDAKPPPDVKPADAEGADPAKAADAKARKKDAAAMVARVLEELKVKTDHPKIKELESVYAQIFEQSTAPAAIALTALNYLGANCGLPKTMVDEATTIIHQTEQEMERAKAAYGAAKKAKAELTAAAKGLKGQALEDITKKIAERDEEVDLAEKGIKALYNKLTLFRNFALGEVAEAVLEPEDFKKKRNLGGDGGDGGPPKGPKDPGDGSGGSGGGGGAGGSGGPSGRDLLWAPGVSANPKGIPGVFGAGGPWDSGDPNKVAAQQARAAQCAAILADPSLCIEDKIFLFMMWFVTFIDREREDKMAEIVAMSDRDARRAKRRDELQQEQQSQGKTVEEMERGVKAAESELARAQQGGKADEIQQAKNKLTLCKSQEAAARNLYDKYGKEYNDLKQASDQVPHSRELMVMELKRLDDLRDKIMNMVRSMMEVSNRNTEKVFR
jgi:hypothetical protein